MFEKLSKTYRNDSFSFCMKDENFFNIKFGSFQKKKTKKTSPTFLGTHFFSKRRKSTNLT